MEPTTEKLSTAKKFTVKKWMVITAAVLLIIIAAVIIMAAIPFKALSNDAFADFLYADIYDQSGERILSVDKDDAEYGELLQKGIDSTRYSVLRSALELNFVNSLRYKPKEVITSVPQYEDEKDGGYIKKDKEGLPIYKDVKTIERVEVKAEDIASKTQSGPGLFVLEFVYATQGGARREIEIKDNSTDAIENKQTIKKITFDRVRLVFNDSKNAIGEYTMYVYDSDTIDSGEAVVTPVLIRMNTTTLYANLCEIRKNSNVGSADNGEYVAPVTETETETETEPVA